MLDLYEEFGRLMSALNGRKIEYALCGGMALAVHKHPRMTVDIDILILEDSLDDAMQMAP